MPVVTAGRGTLARVKHSDFWRLMDDEFGRTYARSLAADQVMAALGNSTAAQALEAGARPRDVWVAVCDAMSVPENRRGGTDGHISEATRTDVPPVLR